MSDTMEEGNIVEWLKQVGDEVEPGDILAEVETDKATMELESYHEGVLLHIGVAEGAVPVNAVIAVIGEEGEDFESQLKEAESSTGDTDNEAEGSSEEKADAPETQEESVSNTSSSGSEQRIKASPLAKKMAEESNIDLSKVKGSGDNGRIVKKDIEEYQASGASTPTPQVSAPAAASVGEAEEVAVSQMRKTIAKRLSQSKFTAPHFYLTREIRMDQAMAARKRINELADTKVSFNDLVVKACAAALKKHPGINSSWLGDKIRYNKSINVGVAVAIDDGLVVPVLFDTDKKTLSEINAEVKDKATRAKERKLSTEEMQGNTFTISNLGMFGIEEFTAIINPPDACILAVGGIVQKPVVTNGEITVGHTMKVTLSCDHRVVDGATGAQFLQTLAAMLEEPMRMLV
jgi:pyruvate dehydrogenase E2 component (dihydrolipoamide acetyltransferase)